MHFFVQFKSLTHPGASYSTKGLLRWGPEVMKNLIKLIDIVATFEDWLSS